MSIQLQTLKSHRNRLNDIYVGKKTTKERIESEVARLEDTIAQAKEEFDLGEKTAEFLRRLGSRARNQAKESVEEMVSNALQFVMEEDIQFRIEYDDKRGRPEANFIIRSMIEGEVVEADPTEARGGGLADVVSATLRIALAELFGVRGPLILDEPTKHLSKRYAHNFAIFIRQISEQFNRQIIMISHDVTLVEHGHISYLVTKVNGVSQVERRDNTGESEIDTSSQTE